MVLKCAIAGMDVHAENVSVPLRGYGFEIMAKVVKKTVIVVSVPLRGYGFEMIADGTVTVEEDRFRPLAGIWF